jgi:hypothetical protein
MKYEALVDLRDLREVARAFPENEDIAEALAKVRENAIRFRTLELIFKLPDEEADLLGTSEKRVQKLWAQAEAEIDGEDSAD